MISKKKCENCGWYQPLDTFGLCEREDGRVNGDPGFSCKHWIGIKYDRAEQKRKDKFELDLATAESNEDNSQFYYDPEGEYEEQYWEDVEWFMMLDFMKEEDNQE